MRTPKWTRAVHTQPPTLHTTEAGPTVGSSSIECWRGTVDELCVAAIELVQAVARTGGSQHAEITWASGSQQVKPDVESLRAALKAGQPDDVLAIRFAITAGNGSIAGTLLAKAKLPGLSVEITGVDRAQVLGITELAFQQMMIGYVDRIGGWRIPTWMLVASSPVAVVLVALNGMHVSYSLLIRLPILLLALVATIVTMALSYEALLIKRPLSIQSQPIPRRSQLTASRIRSVYRHPVTRRVLVIIGALIIGILGNKLTSVVPWP